MALNLNTLTNASTSSTVLAEALTTADFLDSVPILKNLSRGSNKGGDAKQTTGLNQPRALPLESNGDGYFLVGDGVGTSHSGNAQGPSVTIGANASWEAEIDIFLTKFDNYIIPFGVQGWSAGIGLFLINSGSVLAWSKSENTGYISNNGISLNIWHNLKYGYNGTNLFIKVDGIEVVSVAKSNQSSSLSGNVIINQNTLTPKGGFKIKRAKLSINNSVAFDCDFTDSSITDGASSFTSTSGDTVNVYPNGQDPVTLVRFNRLRFSGADTCLGGSFASTISSGYMFVVFRVLGNGGETSGRVFAINSTGQAGHDSTGFIVSAQLNGDIASYYAGWKIQHVDKFDEALGNILHQLKFTASNQLSRFNGGNDTTRTQDMSAISAEEYTIAAGTLSGSSSLNIDILALSLFPSSITDNQAAEIVSYYNSKFSLF
jgi:hypothetical protein